MSEEIHVREWSGVWIPADIWTRTDISWMEKCLLAEIKNLEKKAEGGCWASNEYLGKLFHTSSNTIKFQISKLRSKGLIENVSFDGRRRVIKAVFYQENEEACLPLPLAGANLCRKQVLTSAPPLYIEERIEEKEPVKSSKKCHHPTDEAIRFSNWFKTLLPEGSKVTSSDLTNWAKTYDDAKRLDSRSTKDIADVCRWARASDFWGANFMSATKLRKKNRDGVQYFDVFMAQMKKSTTPKTRADYRKLLQQLGDRADLFTLNENDVRVYTPEYDRLFNEIEAEMNKL